MPRAWASSGLERTTGSPAKVMVRVESPTPGAQIAVGAGESAPSPVEVEAEVGTTLTATVRAPRYRTMTKEIAVSEGMASVVVRLAPEKARPAASSPRSEDEPMKPIFLKTGGSR